MHEFMRLKYLNVTKILSPNRKSECPCHTLIVSIDFGRNDSPRIWAETTHLPRPKRPTLKIGRNDTGRNDPIRNDPGPKRPGFPFSCYIYMQEFCSSKCHIFRPFHKHLNTFVWLLFNVPENKYGYARTVTSDYVAFLTDIEMNESHAIKQQPSK